MLVGRNDTGKTGVLNNFMQNFYGQWTIGTDTPQLPRLPDPGPHQKYSIEWKIDPGDEVIMRNAFGVAVPVRTLSAAFDDARARAEKWAYQIDGTAAPVPANLTHRDIFPVPSYVQVAGPEGPRDRLLPDRFAAQFVRIAKMELETATFPDPVIPIEGVLARLAGLRSHTRRLPGPGADDPWENSLATPGLSVAELNDAFRPVAAAVNEQLQRWWREPNDVQFKVSVVGDQSRNSYWVTCEVRTRSGLMMRGAGIRWFIAMALELLFLNAVDRPRLLLFDEPGTPLHPSAQRAVTRMLMAFAADCNSQLIYSTHSPFMIDWSFPQRIRLFERDFDTGKGAIINNPYHPGSAFATVWDPLRSAIGVTLGDLSQVGERNVFVEGVSDQIILANASADALSRGASHLDLSRTAIVPYTDHQSLQRLLDAASSFRSRSVAVIDTDRPRPDNNVARFQTAGIPCVTLDKYSDTATAAAAIEDVIGVDDYLRCLNASYEPFFWFHRFDPDVVRAKRGTKTLGRYLAETFDEIGQSFSKVRVATEIAVGIQNLSLPTKLRLDQLLRELTIHLR